VDVVPKTNHLMPLLLLVVAVLVVALYTHGGQVITAFAISATNSSAATVNLTNVPTQISTVRCFDSSNNALLTIPTTNLSLVAGAFKQIYCNATANDPDGVNDVLRIFGSVRTDKATSGDLCFEDDRWCYVNNTCENATAINTTAKEVRCTYKLWFNADNTTQSGSWTPNITTNDTASMSYGNVGNRTNFSTDTLLAIGVDSLIAFGNKKAGINMTNVGGTTATAGGTDTTCDAECNQTVKNYGNVQIALMLNASVLQCTIGGSVPAGFLRTNITYNSAFGESYILTSTLTDSTTALRNFALNENTTASVRNSDQPLPSQKDTYWGIGVPNGAQGNCQGAIYFAAVLA
jgi:hypothetical protein